MYDSIDVIYKLVGADEESPLEDVEDLVYSTYNISIEDLDALIRQLLKFTPIIQTSITRTNVHAFIDYENNLILMKENV